MNQLLQSSIHLTLIQFIIVFIGGVAALLLGFRSLIYWLRNEKINAPMFSSFILAVTMSIGTLVWSINQINEAIANHQYTAKINGKLLELESNSDNIRSDAFEIIYEDSNSIQVKKVTRYGQTNFTIEKSELDK